MDSRYHDNHLSASEKILDNVADALEKSVVPKHSMGLLPQKEVVMVDLVSFEQDTRPLAKIWCVKLENDAHRRKELNFQIRVLKTYLKVKYSLFDFLRAQKNDCLMCSLKRWIQKETQIGEIWRKTVTGSSDRFIRRRRSGYI